MNQSPLDSNEFIPFFIDGYECFMQCVSFGFALISKANASMNQALIIEIPWKPSTMEVP